MLALLLVIVAAHAISPRIANLAKLTDAHVQESAGYCFHISDPSAKFSSGTCSQAGDPQSKNPSMMCDYNEAAAGWTEGTCQDDSTYTDGCFGRYDIVFFLQPQNCHQCCDANFRPTEDASCTCNIDGVCYDVNTDSTKFPKGTCSQAGSEQAPSSMCDFNVSQGWKMGECEDDTMFTIPCVGKYDIIIWISPADCDVCKGGMFHLLNPNDCASAEVLTEN